MKRSSIIIIILLSLFFLPFTLKAAPKENFGSVVVSPTVIDKRCEKRDLFEYSIKIKNNTDGIVNLYALVNDISPGEGSIEYNDPSELDQATSLTRWINFTRGVIKLNSGEETEILLTIKISPFAVPGKYHARIILSRGSDQTNAKENALKRNEAELLINIEVEEHIVEKAEIAEFRPVKGVFTKSPIGFFLKIKNIGNTDIQPKGDIAVYTKGGKELGSVNFNKDGHSILQGQTKDFSVILDFPEKLGRFKAKLRVEYGRDRKDLQDVVYFLVLSKNALILIGFIILILVIFLAAFMSKRKYRMIKLANKEMGDEIVHERDEYIKYRRIEIPQKKKKIKKNEKLEKKDYIIDLKKK